MVGKLLFVLAALFFSAASFAEELAAPSVLSEPVKNLMNYALSQEGVNYRKGGASPDSGFDCSGFVRYVFDQVEGLLLPHSSRAMSLIGRRVGLGELKPGDLVFFRVIRNRISHVGIYLGQGRFIHAASARTGNVVISRLTEKYWEKRFTLAKRIEPPDQEKDGLTLVLDCKSCAGG